eukprot:2646461-Rhodomonas_salina.1
MEQLSSSTDEDASMDTPSPATGRERFAEMHIRVSECLESARGIVEVVCGCGWSAKGVGQERESVCVCVSACAARSSSNARACLRTHKRATPSSERLQAEL